MTRMSLLDHGYIELVEAWGSDQRIIESARMSTDKGFLGWGPVHAEDCVSLIPPKFVDIHHGVIQSRGPCNCEPKLGDEKLLRFLWEKKHSTPFEFCGLTLEIQAPIFVFREWHRHRTQSYSELSARYTPMPDLNYVPDHERCMLVSTTNKQASRAAGAPELTSVATEEWLIELRNLYIHAEHVYQSGLSIGIPKELARLPVPVARYSRMRATANLRNWLLFLTLRQAPDAQWEIRQYADAVATLVEQEFPRTWALYLEGHQ